MTSPSPIEPCPSLQRSHPGFVRRDFSGAVYDLIERELSPYNEYLQVRAGEISAADYLRSIENSGGDGLGAALTENQRHLVARFPRSEEEFVDLTLQGLQERGIIDAIDYPKRSFQAFRERVRTSFDHGGYMTFIFPEEERLVFALSHIMRPSNALFLGSYYGYWGIWMLPAISLNGGEATFIDPNPRTNAVARKNVSALGFGGCTTVLEAEGTQYLRESYSGSSFDFLLLDAEGPDDAVDPSFRGKRVYLPLIQAAHPYLSPGATVMVHNILLTSRFPSRYFEGLIQKNTEELNPFIEYTANHFSHGEAIDSTEGIGIYRVSKKGL